MGWRDDPIAGGGGFPQTKWQQDPPANTMFSATAQAAEQYEPMPTQQRIELQTDAPFQPDAQLEDFLLRADMARSNEPEERQMKLQSKYPDYESQIVNTRGGQELVFRPPGEEAFRPVDTPRQIDMQDAGDLAGALLNAENMMAIGSMALTRTPAAWWGRMLQAGTGGGAGNVVDNQLEAARGYQTNTASEQATEAGMAALTAALGEEVGSLAAGGRRTLMGERAGLTKPGGREDVFLQGLENLNQFYKDEGINNPVRSSLGDIYPVVERKMNQAAATNRNVSDFREQRQLNLVDNMRQALGDSDTPTMSDEGLLDISDQLKDFLYGAYDETPGSELAVREAGQALQTGREAFRQGSREQINQLYDDAFSRATPDIKFDIAGAQNSADELTRGVVGAAKEGDEGVNIAPNFTPEMRKALDTLSSLRSDIQSAEPGEAFRQLKELRSLFNDLKQPNPQTGLYDNQSRTASRLYSELTDALNNPQGGSEDFVQAYRTASDANRTLDETMNLDVMKKIARSDNPQNLFRQIADSGDYQALSKLQETLPQKEYGKLKEGFENYLLLKPEDINKTLDGFARDKDSLNKLMPKERQKQLRSFGVAAERVRSAPVEKVIRSTVDTGERALRIMRDSDEQSFKTFVDTATASDPNAKRKILAGAIGKVFDNNMSVKNGRVNYNVKKISNEIDSLIREGKLKYVADARQLSALRDTGYVGSVLSAAGSDVGASMHAGAVADEALSLNPVQAGSGLLEVVHNGFWGWATTNPAVIRIFAGGGKPTTTAGATTDALLKTISRVSLNAVDDIERASAIELNEPETQTEEQE